MIKNQVSCFFETQCISQPEIAKNSLKTPILGFKVQGSLWTSTPSTPITPSALFDADRVQNKVLN